jgi:hypothetical protein
MPDALTLTPTSDPHVFRVPDGTLLSPPRGGRAFRREMPGSPAA